MSQRKRGQQPARCIEETLQESGSGKGHPRAAAMDIPGQRQWTFQGRAAGATRLFSAACGFWF